MAGLRNTASHMTFGKLRIWYDYESLLHLPIGKWKLTDVKGVFVKT